MQNWSISSLKLPLKFNWKISRNTSEFKENLIIRVNEAEIFGEGEVAFNVRYGESKEKILEEFAFFTAKYEGKSHFEASDLPWLLSTEALSASLKMGINQAYINFISKRDGSSIKDLLHIEVPHKLHTSFSIPIIEEEDIKSFLNKNQLLHYRSLKLKINGIDSIFLVNRLLKEFNGKIRIDANEGFRGCEEVLAFIDSIDDLSKIEFIEQPLPVSLNHEMISLKGQSGVLYIADESITCHESIAELAPLFDGVNIKLMKSGTLENAIDQIKCAKSLKMKTMLGCMIETSLSISFAFLLARNVDYIDLDGFLLIKDDPYKLLLESKGIITQHHTRS